MGRKRSLTMEPTPKLVDDEEDTSSESASDDDNDDQIVDEALWSMEEQKKLIEDITAQLPKIDRASCFRRIKKINWEKVSIENRTEKECKEHLDKMIKKIRHQRNLNEVLCDVIVNLEKKPSLTVKPQSAYTLYCKHLILQKPDMKGKNFFQEASNNFKKLSDAEKAVFERESTKQRELYLLEKKKLTEAKMDELTPTPFVLFCKYHMALGSSNKSILRSQYGHLPDEEKLSWIRKAVKEIKESNEQIDLSTFLNKHEKKLLEGVPKLPKNAYNLFVRDFCSNKDNDFKKAAEQYRSLNEKVKAKYVNEAEELKRTYQAEMEVFMESLTEEERQQRKKSNKKTTNVEEKPDTAAAASDSAVVKAKPKQKKAAAASELLIPKVEPGTEKVTPTSKKALAAKEAGSGGAQNGSARKRKSTSDTPVKMKVEKIAEPEKVPSSAFKYFVAREYTGKPKKARSAYSAMTPANKKRVKHAFKICLKEYMSQLETYLQSLTKDEMIEYADRSRQMEDESDDSCSDSSSSDSSETSE